MCCQGCQHECMGEECAEEVQSLAAQGVSQFSVMDTQNIHHKKTGPVLHPSAVQSLFWCFLFYVSLNEPKGYRMPEWQHQLTSCERALWFPQWLFNLSTNYLLVHHPPCFYHLVFHISNLVNIELSFRFYTITVQEVLVMWRTVTKLRELRLISSSERWWCVAATLFQPLPLTSDRKKKLFFIIPQTEEDLYPTMWLLNSVEIEKWQSSTFKAKIDPFEWKQKER